MDNHYHTLGYLRIGETLPKMMQRLHGATSKLVNDLLPRSFKPFWRDERQARLAYRYTLIQSVRHGMAADRREYPHTRINIELEPAIRRALELQAFLEGVPYKRYQRGRSTR